MNSKYSLSCWGIDNYLYDVEDRIRQQSESIDYASIAPLRWYITTGRASADFLRRLFTVRPAYIARILRAGGSYDEVVFRVKARVYRDAEDLPGEVP